MNAGENANAIDLRCQRSIGHGFELDAIDGLVAVARDPERAGNGQARGLVVAGDHDRADSGRLTGCDGGRGLCARWIDLAHQPEERGPPTEWFDAGVAIDLGI